MHADQRPGSKQVGAFVLLTGTAQNVPAGAEPSSDVHAGQRQKVLRTVSKRTAFFVAHPLPEAIELSADGIELTAEDIARGLSTNVLRNGISDAVVVFRPFPEPVAALLGYRSADAVGQFEALQWHLQWSLSRLRYVGYRQAEGACALLAGALIHEFGREEISRFRFTGIPRGGLIVLGMLSYILQLNHEQTVSFGAEPLPHAPLVVVDDCALSGFRFGQFLQRLPERSVIFAHLYSHPDLRRAIVDRERQVMASVAAHDLEDHAPQVYGGAYDSWRERVWGRANGRCYWVGLPDYLCFAWNEPDFTVWNPRTEREETVWRILPPELCLKNRVGEAGRTPELQVQPEGVGPMKPPPHVLYGVLEDELIVGETQTGNSYRLEGTAAEIWQSILRHGNVEDVAGELLQLYDVDEKQMRADVADFVAKLEDAGLLGYYG